LPLPPQPCTSDLEKFTSPSSLQDEEKSKPIPSDTGPYSTFSAGTRIYSTYCLGIVMILSTLTATIYFPLIPALSIHFNVSI
jgi:hypothetical protein